MTSGSDDLEQALQENLKLRSELAANVAKTKGSGSQRVSRGFHRLAIFLAAIPLLVGLATSFYVAKDVADPENTGPFLINFGTGLAITLAAALAVYCLVRAIGWVIGGFAAS